MFSPEKAIFLYACETCSKFKSMSNGFFYQKVNLSFDGVLKTPSFFYQGWGVESTPPPIFICENNRKSNKIMHWVDFF